MQQLPPILEKLGGGRRVVLFTGTTIGNITHDEAPSVLTNPRTVAGAGVLGVLDCGCVGGVTPWRPK